MSWKPFLVIAIVSAITVAVVVRVPMLRRWVLGSGVAPTT